MEHVEESEVVKAIVKSLEGLLEVMEHCTVEDGVCCCGDNMKNHPNPMNCGHSPVDHGTYIANQLYEQAHNALDEYKKSLLP